VRDDWHGQPKGQRAADMQKVFKEVWTVMVENPTVNLPTEGPRKDQAGTNTQTEVENWIKTYSGNTDQSLAGFCDARPQKYSESICNEHPCCQWTWGNGGKCNPIKADDPTGKNHGIMTIAQCAPRIERLITYIPLDRRGANANGGANKMSHHDHHRGEVKGMALGLFNFDNGKCWSCDGPWNQHDWKGAVLNIGFVLLCVTSGRRFVTRFITVVEIN